LEEGFDGAAHGGVAAVDDAEGADEAGAEFCDFDAAFFGLFFDYGMVDDADAVAEDYGLFDHLQVVEVHDHFDFSPM
jgi:hypothetical protein